MNGPSPHLSWDELACRDRLATPYPLDWRESRAALLAREFEGVREALARRLGFEMPLIVLSGYRTPAHNHAEGGAFRSQHLHGRALDIYPADQRYLDDLYDVALRRALAVLAIRGLGRYNTFVHLDIRPAAELARWDFRTGVAA